MSESKLFQILLQANHAYHTGTPVMTDDEFDALLSQWESISGKQWGDVVGVGVNSSSTEHTTVPIPMWMGAMNKVKETNDITKWLHRWKPNSVIVTDKLDGISCLIEWIPKRSSIRVFTRGNGTKGTDITRLTDTIPTLSSLKSLLLSGSKSVPWIFHTEYSYYIRGELCIPRDSWESER